MSTTQTDRSENAYKDFFSFWKNNPPAFPSIFSEVEKTREACREIWKIDQGYGLKIYSLWVEHLMKMLASGYNGNTGEIYRNGNECWTAMAALMEKYYQERATAAAKFWPSFFPARGDSAGKA